MHKLPLGRNARAVHTSALRRRVVVPVQVRDAACLACGRCVTAFPEESREVLEVRAGWGQGPGWAGW